MVKSSSDKIVLKKVVDYPFENAKLNEIASPGHLVELLSTGNIQKNDSGFADAIGVLVENEAVSGEKTTAYASGDIASYCFLSTGMVIQARVAASATAIAFGDRVGAVTGGTVGKLTIPPADLTNAQLGYLGIALEAVDNSGGSEEAFIKIRIK